MSNGTRVAFTLIEVLLSLAVVGIMTAIALPLYYQLELQNDLEIEAASIAQAARRAQILSMANASDTTWGFAVQGNTVTLFQGTSFADRNPAYDESASVSSQIVASGTIETVFRKLTGTPQATGTITLTSPAGTVKTIIINSQGVVNY